MRPLPFLAAAVLLAACVPGSPATERLPPPDLPAVPVGATPSLVLSVQDGDSLLVEVDGREEQLRLIGVNAPEHDECWGAEAQRDLARLAQQEVHLSFDVEERDQYDRLLAYVWDDGVLVNAALVQNGSALGSAFGENTNHKVTIDAAEAVAKSERRGMWAADACGDTPPEGLVILRIDANPPGPDDDHLDEESITIANTGTEPISLGGMALRDASTTHRFVFAEELVLVPGGELRIVTGCGSDTSAVVHWCSDGPVWDNDGDEALITTVKGTIITHFEYAP